MSKKEAVKTEAAKKDEFQYGIAASLMINIVKDKRVYRFEMPVGAKLEECEEACNVCSDIVKKMKEDGEVKMAEEKAKDTSAKAESGNEDLKSGGPKEK